MGDLYDPYSPAVQGDPFPYYEECLEKCPVHHHVLSEAEVERINQNPLVAKPTDEFFTVFRHRDVSAILQEHFLSGQGPGLERAMPLDGVGMLVYADEPHHGAQRRILNKLVAPKFVKYMEPEITRLVHELIDEFVALGAVDLVPAFTERLPVNVLAQILGVPTARWEDLKRWNTDTLLGFGGDADSWERSATAFLEFSEYFSAVIQERRALLDAEGELPDDFLTTLLTSDYQGRTFNDLEILMALQIMLIGGGETTTSALANTVVLLLSHKEELEALIASDWALLDNTIEESLRLWSPVQGLFRTTTEEVCLHGVDIPQDAKVRVMLPPPGPAEVRPVERIRHQTGPEGVTPVPRLRSRHPRLRGRGVGPGRARRCHAGAVH